MARDQRPVVRRPVGLGVRFYNSVCLPLFTVLVGLLAVCPWLRWKGGVRDWKKFGATAAVFVAALAVFWRFGVSSAPTPYGRFPERGLSGQPGPATDRPGRTLLEAALAALLVHTGLL